MATHETPSRGTSWLRTLGAGYGLGIGGAALALVLSFAVLIPLALAGISSIGARLLVLFVFGQYVPFMGFPLTYLRWRGFDRAAIRDYLGVRVPTLRELGVVVAGLVAVFVLAVGASALVARLGLNPASNSSAELARDVPSVIPLLIVASLVVIGPCEETLFRGGVQNRLRESFSAPVAITLTAVLFAAVHVTALTGGIGARLTTIVVLLAPSFVFGAVYEYTGNLVVPALIHGLWNAFLFSSIWWLLSTGGEVPGAALLGVVGLPA